MAILNSTQLIDRFIINGAKLINLPPESPLFRRLISWLETCSKQRSQYISLLLVPILLYWIQVLFLLYFRAEMDTFCIKHIENRNIFF